MSLTLKDAVGVRPSEPPTVSVAITTYNAERCIRRALDSVLDQRTEFAVEIVVADDCSADGTVSIVQSYQARYPEMVRLIARPQNVGMQRNYYDAFEQSRGKYIAWLDYDDYWTDPDKLQLQVEVLESDPSLTICGHYVRWVAADPEGEIRRERYPSVSPGRHGMRSILHSCLLPSPSVMFRNGLQRELPQWYFDAAPLSDWPLHVVAAGKGDVFLIDKVMADYTLNSTSTVWGKGELYWHQLNVEFYRRVRSILPRQFHRQIGAEMGKQYETIAYIVRKQGDFIGSRKAALKAFQSPSLIDNVGSKTKSLVASVAREAQWRLGGRKSAA